MNTVKVVKLNPHLYEYISDNPDKFGLTDSPHSTRINEILEQSPISEELRFEIDSLIGRLLNENEKEWFSVSWHCAKNPESMVIL